MWHLVTYSNYFEIVSTVTFLDSQTGLISGIFLFNSMFILIHLNVHWTKLHQTAMNQFAFTLVTESGLWKIYCVGG